MNAKDVMTSPVLTISPNTTVQEITTLLLKHQISGVPVVDMDQVVGIVSKSDLLHRYEADTDYAPVRRWWDRWIQTSAPPLRYVRAHGTRAVDIMTRAPVSITEDFSLARIAQLLTSYRIQRVPVIRGQRLVGIVTSGDLVQALQANSEAPRAVADSPAARDEEIQVRLVQELKQQDWWSPLWSHVSVEQGVVTYNGTIGNEAERDAGRVAAESIAGVRGVIDNRIRADEWQVMY